ncbi:MAG TPA: aspartate/glutamate racemase family protein [Anaerolineales bacterium]|nr:aspartate/glutamate racemase family protein [Anaerolineales bacterium]
MTTLAIIHTTPATIDTMKMLAAEILPVHHLVNFVDDSILPQLGQNGGNLADVEERLVHYARFAEQVGADVILEACSSVGELASRMRSAVSIPVVRIDEAMAEQAVQRGERLGVAATLRTTLQPTTRLLHAKAQTAGKQVEITPLLIEGAYEKLMAGDREGHDNLLVEKLQELAQAVDVVVLAQASMARVLPRLSAADQGKILVSPRLAMEQVKTVMASLSLSSGKEN